MFQIMHSWVAHGRRSGKVAKQALACAPNAPMPKKGRMLAWHFGILGGLAYGGLGALKNRVRS